MLSVSVRTLSYLHGLLRSSLIIIGIYLWSLNLLVLFNLEFIFLIIDLTTYFDSTFTCIHIKICLNGHLNSNFLVRF